MPTTEPLSIAPDAIYRVEEAKAIFGYSPSVLRERIKNGTVPKPVLLAPPPSRARGWYGATIIEHRKKVAASQQEWEENAQKFYAPKGGDLSKNPPAEKPKPKKVKGLKRPARRSPKGDH